MATSSSDSTSATATPLTTATVKVFTPSCNVFPLSGYGNLRTVQDARRYLGATRVLLAQVKDAPSGVPFEVRMPLGDAWFQVNVGLSLCDDYIRLGRTWFDSIDEVDGLRDALQGLLRAFAHARPSWQRWDTERKAVSAAEGSTASTGSTASSAPAASPASSSLIPVVASSSSVSDKSTTAKNGLGLSTLKDLSAPTPNATYVGLGVAALAALLLWQFTK